MHGRSFGYILTLNFIYRIEKRVRFIEIDTDRELTVCDNRKIIAVWTNAVKSNDLRWKHHLFITNPSNFKKERFPPTAVKTKNLSIFIWPFYCFLLHQYVYVSRGRCHFSFTFPRINGNLKIIWYPGKNYCSGFSDLGFWGPFKTFICV